MIKEDGRDRKLHLISWKQVCRPKSHGGLGLVPLRIRNLSLLDKWTSRWDNERGKAWNVWLREKYQCGIHDNLLQGLQNKSLSNSMQDIARAISHPLFKVTMNQQNFKWKVRNGSSTLFWEDYWIGNGPLMNTFKKFYALSNWKKVTVCNFLHNWNNSSSTEVNINAWSRPLRAWELDDLKNLEKFIDSISLYPGCDTLIWLPIRAPYSVKNASEKLLELDGKVPWEFIWHLRIPQKIKIFLWKLSQQILPTKEFLKIRGIIKDDSVVCSLCHISRETVDYLFLRCEVARFLWDGIFQWWNIQLSVAYIYSIMHVWKLANLFPSKKITQVWKIVVAAACWALWLARNQRISRHQILRKDSILVATKLQSQEWILAFEVITETASSWWFSNPLGSITHSESSQIKQLMNSNFKFIGFCDGS